MLNIYNNSFNYQPKNAIQNIPFKQNSLNNTPNTSVVDSSQQKEKSVYNGDVTHTSWFFITDVHGKMTNMERLCNISKEFDRIAASEMTKNFFNSQEEKVSKFKVSSGDIVLGGNFLHNQVAGQFLKWSGITHSAYGNHEFDVPNVENLSTLLKSTDCKMLASNILVNPNSPLADKIEKSTILEKDGIKYGLIGIAPSDMFDRVKLSDTSKAISVLNKEQTIDVVKNEVESLKKQGINHIVLLSHAGHKVDQRMAQEIDGIDLIFGGHTHELVKGIKEGENLFYSKSGEPVVITQAGKDGENCGILNVDFDKNGVITKVQNNIIQTREYNRPLFVKDAVEKILGKPEVIGKVGKTLPPPKNRLIESNPHANMLVDAMRAELDTDIALVNAGNIRGHFSVGPVDTRTIYDITPFDNHMMVIKLSEKQIVDAIKYGCHSTTKSSCKPGLLFVSGLRYKANKKGELLNLEFVDKNKQIHKIDINNPSETKTYTVAADDFFATGGDGYIQKNEHPDFVIKELQIDKDILACNYIKKLEQPIEIIDDGRIEIVD